MSSVRAPRWHEQRNSCARSTAPRSNPTCAVRMPACPPPADLVRAHAADAVATRLQWLKQARRTFGFADLLERLHRALGEPGTPEGQALRERIRRQYPVALVDEFQDTSPLQLSIFERVYGLHDNRQDGALLLIGDPKQSIYAFRGADIHSYLEARRATAGRHHALPCNFRSTQAMVAAVNALFLRAEQIAGFNVLTVDLDRASVARYGLDAAATTLTLTGKDGKAVVAFAVGKQEGGLTYVRIPGQPTLYAIDSKTLGDLPTTAEELLL